MPTCFQWFDNLKLYQVNGDSGFPHHEIEPTDAFTNEDDLPIDIGFPMNPNNEMIVVWNYNSGSGDDFTMTIQAQDPPSN